MDSSNKEQPVNDQVGAPLTGRRFHRRLGDIHEQEESSHLWLVTFTDVMALMLTFFVLLFSMTEPVKEEWSEVTSSLQAEFGKLQGGPASRGPQDFVNIDKINFNRALNMNYLKVLMEAEIGDNEYLKNALLTPQQGSLIISLPNELLFEAGDATVGEEGARALYALGGTLSRMKNKIEIIGHADPRVAAPVAGEFGSNWELSMLRAANVAAILEKVGYRSDIAIHGFSSGRYDDLQGIADEDKRLELSRRVDIVVMDHDGSRQEVVPDLVLDE